ncbi:SSI family serine proteinase inhibitor [Actinorugispora endophytica]|uniref:Subtilisin inhibitor-like n=1 Tax=Actinorugispora endophytica TaxID=1605990 RepID=A0A4R6V7N6_9ACTN|nr:SSI family serine proteinase inhibitor [Actinorugispora endophytica]TDQ52313.1 subtilisin inhibitor-like [Actinorugispora endophytica]
MRNHIPTTALVRLTLLAAMGLLIAGCGGGTTGGDVEERPSSPATGDGARTELTIERAVDSESDTPTGLEGFSPGTWTLACSPAGGDHPAPEAACAALEEAGDEPFAPVPDDQACTMVYGGPEVVTITGHIDQTEVNAEFNRSNGCEINRWESLSPVLNP